MTIIKRIIGLLVLIEVSSMLALYVASRVPGINLVYTPPKNISLTDYLEGRDQLTGWPTKKLLNSRHFDINGARPNPFLVDNDSIVIQVFGDSFARGAEVDNEHCWSNLMAKEEGIKVMNYGVDGYGTDQAYLRYTTKTSEEQHINLVGFTSDNIMRNVNTYRNLLSADMSYIGIKPRFVIDDTGSIQLQGLDKSLDIKKLDNIINNPKENLKSEYFLSSEGPQYFILPFSISFLKLFNHYLIKSKLTNKSFYHEFFSSEHPSLALETTAQVLAKFSTPNNKVRTLFLFFPQEQDFYHYTKHNEWIYEPLIRTLREKNSKFKVLNIGEYFVSQDNFENNISSYLAPRKHYNEKGNRVVAEAISNKLSELKWTN